MRVILFIALAGLLVLACDTGTGADGGLTGWDWARAIARDAVDLAYGEHWYITSFYAENLDISGNLYEDMSFPVWNVYYSDGSDTYLWVLIHSSGQYTIFKIDGSYYTHDPLTSTYDSETVASWLRIASRVYRDLTGLADDVCYGMDCWHEEEMYECDLVSIGLYDVDLERLAVAYLLAQTGEITEFDLYE